MNNKKITLWPVLRILSGFIVLLLIGCQTSQSPVARAQPCNFPDGTNVEQVFSDARDDLARSECQFQFDSYFDGLL